MAFALTPKRIMLTVLASLLVGVPLMFAGREAYNGGTPSGLYFVIAGMLISFLVPLVLVLLHDLRTIKPIHDIQKPLVSS